MRLAAVIAMIASPALAQENEKPLLKRDCMEVMGAAIYGPETYGAGVILGITIGYVVANGGKPEDAKKIGKLAGKLCRQNPGFTYGDVLRTFDHD